MERDDLDELVGIAKRSLVRDSLTNAQIKFRVFEDPDFDPKLSLVALLDEKIVSFVSATNPTKFPPGFEPPQEKAWLKVFMTDEGFKRKGLASELFDLIVNELRDRNVEEVRFSDRGNWHFWPGIDLGYEDGFDFLEKHGFVKDLEELDYIYDLKDFVYPRRIQRLKARLESEGIFIRRAQKSEKEKVGDWVGKEFDPFWQDEAERAMSNPKPSVLIAQKRDRILGFATYDALVEGRFGPAGVSGSERKKGIGAALLFDTFTAMKNEGEPQCTVHWTDHLFYYTQVPGLCGVRHYWIMRKEIPKLP